jgi:hypothetical protein
MHVSGNVPELHMSLPVFPVVLPERTFVLPE